MWGVLLPGGGAVRAAGAPRGAAGRWRRGGQGAAARRCHERANKLDPAGATRMVAPAPDPAAGKPRLTPPTAPAAPAAPPVGRRPAATPPAADRPTGAPRGFTRDLPFIPSHRTVEPD